MKVDSLLKNIVLLTAACLLSALEALADTTDVEVDSLLDTAAIQVSTDSTRLLWHRDFGHDVILEHVMPDGRLFVVTDSVGCFMLKNESGEPEWSLPELKGMKSAKFELIPNTTIACLLECQTTPKYSRVKRKYIDHYHNALAVIDYVAGKVLWSSDKFGFASVQGFYYLPPTQGLMLYGRDTGKTTWTVAASLNSGDLLWRNDSLFGPKGPRLTDNAPNGDCTLNGQQMPAFDSDSSMIIFMEKKAIRRINLHTGRLIWQCDVDASDTPSPVAGYSQALITPNHQTIYFPLGDSVMAMRTVDGGPVWDSPPVLLGRVYQMELIPQGLLVRGGSKITQAGGHDYIMLLDTANGKLKWSEPFKKANHLVSSNFALLDGQVYIYSKKKLWMVNPADGVYSEVARKIQFKAEELSPKLEIRNHRLLVTEINNLGLFEVNGQPIYAVSHKAPNATFGQFMEAFAISLSWAMVIGFAPNIPYGDPKVAQVTQNYTYILTYVGDEPFRKPGLVKVNRNTGATEAAIKLGDRTPLFAGDEQRARLYFVRNDQTVECYAF
jgi:hypothetical protein